MGQHCVERKKENGRRIREWTVSQFHIRFHVCEQVYHVGVCVCVSLRRVYVWKLIASRGRMWHDEPLPLCWPGRHARTHARARTHTQRLLCRPNSYKHTMTTDIHQRQWDISVNSRFRLLVYSQQSKQLAFFSFFFSSGVRSLPERRIRVGAKNVCLTFPWFTTAGLHAVHQTRTLRALRQPSYLCEVTWRTPAF